MPAITGVICDANYNLIQTCSWWCHWSGRLWARWSCACRGRVGPRLPLRGCVALSWRGWRPGGARGDPRSGYGEGGYGWGRWSSAPWAGSSGSGKPPRQNAPGASWEWRSWQTLWNQESTSDWLEKLYRKANVEQIPVQLPLCAVSEKTIYSFLRKQQNKSHHIKAAFQWKSTKSLILYSDFSKPPSSRVSKKTWGFLLWLCIVPAAGST